LFTGLIHNLVVILQGKGGGFVTKLDDYVFLFETAKELNSLVAEGTLEEWQKDQLMFLLEDLLLREKEKT
jgi:hypothetical protein